MNEKSYREKLQNPRWQRRRLEIMQRANFKCEGCGNSEKQLEIHHKNYETGREPNSLHPIIRAIEVGFAQGMFDNEREAFSLRLEIMRFQKQIDSAPEGFWMRVLKLKRKPWNQWKAPPKAEYADRWLQHARESA